MTAWTRCRSTPTTFPTCRPRFSRANIRSASSAISSFPTPAVRANSAAGSAARKEFRMLADIDFIAHADRHLFQPWGLFGGGPGAKGMHRRNAGQPGEAVLPSKGGPLSFKKGDVLCAQAAGGGGYGQPEDRRVDLLAVDFADGKVTEAEARKDLSGRAGRCRSEAREHCYESERRRTGKAHHRHRHRRHLHRRGTDGRTSRHCRQVQGRHDAGQAGELLHQRPRTRAAAAARRTRSRAFCMRPRSRPIPCWKGKARAPHCSSPKASATCWRLRASADPVSMTCSPKKRSRWCRGVSSSRSRSASTPMAASSFRSTMANSSASPT